MIGVSSSGSFDQTVRFLNRIKGDQIYANLNRFGRQGVEALSSATPIETSETAKSWGYQVNLKGGKASISWFNTHTEDGVNIAVIIQYGHGTGTGGYVQGRDYIMPAIRPVFDRILEDVWRQVTNA